MRGRLWMGAFIFAVLGALPQIAWSAFPVTGANVNSGTVMPQSPRWPFPQFKGYPYGKSLADVNPDGVPHAEMEATLVQAYVEAMRRLKTVTGWKPSGLPNRLAFVGNPTTVESDGYALLMAAYMADKDTFDGLWVEIHSYLSGVASYADGSLQQPSSNESCRTLGLPDWTHGTSGNTSTDGDEDITLAMLVAWRQWGDDSGYLQYDGSSISYRDEFTRLSGAMALWRPEPGDTADHYGAADIGIDGYVKASNTNGEFTDWAAAAHGDYPAKTSYCAGQGVANCSPKSCLSYLAPGYYRAIRSALLDAGSNTQAAGQFLRAATSSEYVIEALNAQRAPFSIGTDGYGVDDAGVVSFGSGTWGANLAEGIRTPFRNGLTYLWYGTPSERWDPIAHMAVSGTNTAERDFVDAYAKAFYDPREQGNAPFNEYYGLTFWGFAQWRVGSGWSTSGLFPGSSYATWAYGPMAVAACGAHSMPVTQQYELMMNAYRQLVLCWDKSAESGVQTGAPVYFDSFFRWMGLMALTGNFSNPASMIAQPNLKVYCSVGKTFASPGEPVTYVVSYRNYGAADGTSVSLEASLPAPLLYVSATGPVASSPGAGMNGVVRWSVGAVPGLQNTAGGSGNLGSTQGAVTLVAQVDPAATPQKVRMVPKVYVGSALHWTANDYPNEISMTYRQNDLDITGPSLQFSLSPSASTACAGQTVTFTMSVTNATAAWLDGGRPRVYPGFSADVTLVGGPMAFYSQIRSEAFEPLINPCDYRWSFYFSDPVYGYGGLPVTQMAYSITAAHNANTYGTSAQRTLADFLGTALPDHGLRDSLSLLPVGTGSDANGSWNQRYVFRWFDTVVPSGGFIYGNRAGIPSLWYGQKYSGNTGVHLQYGDLNTPSPSVVFLVQPSSDRNRPATLWAGGGANGAWSWMGPEGAAQSTSGSSWFNPVSPDWTTGDGSSVPVSLLDPYATQSSTALYTRCLVEEWDGSVWRRVFGTGPVPGRDIASVHVTANLPSGVDWSGWVGAPQAGSVTFTGSTASWDLDLLPARASYAVTFVGTVQSSVTTPSAWAILGGATAPLEPACSMSVTLSVPAGTCLTPTPAPSATETPTATRTWSASPTSSPTPLWTETVSPTATITGTETFTVTSTPTPTPPGYCFMLDDLQDGDAVNNTGGAWRTSAWLWQGGTPVVPNGVSVSPSSMVVDAAQHAESSGYSARITGASAFNSGTTVGGFTLTTELGPSYTDLSWVQSIRFAVRATQACTLRMNLTNPRIAATPLPWNGSQVGGGGNDDQYGYTFPVTAVGAWVTVSVDRGQLACQDWGYGSCPPVNAGVTYARDPALAQVCDLSWLLQIPTSVSAVSLTFWIDQVCLTAREGYALPVTATASQTVTPTPASFTPSATPTPSPTAPVSMTATYTVSATPTSTETAISTWVSPTWTATVSASPTANGTSSPLPTPMPGCARVTVEGRTNCNDTLPSNAAQAAIAVKVQVTPGQRVLLHIVDGCISYGSDWVNGVPSQLFGTRLRVFEADDLAGSNLVQLGTVGNGSYDQYARSGVSLDQAVSLGHLSTSCAAAQSRGLNSPYNDVVFAVGKPYLYLTADDIYYGYCGDNLGAETVDVCPTTLVAMTPTSTPTFTPSFTPTWTPFGRATATPTNTFAVTPGCRVVEVRGKQDCVDTDPSVSAEAAAAVKVAVTPGLNYRLTILGGCISYGSDWVNGAPSQLYGTRLRLLTASDTSGGNMTRIGFVGTGSYMQYATSGYCCNISRGVSVGALFQDCDGAWAATRARGTDTVVIAANQPYLYLVTDDIYRGYCGDNLGSEFVEICQTNDPVSVLTPTRTPTRTPTGTPSVGVSLTLTPWPSGTATPSFTVSGTFTATATWTASVFVAPTGTPTPTRTPSSTETWTLSPTPTWTVSRTFTASPTPSASWTPTSTPTATPRETMPAVTPTRTPGCHGHLVEPPFPNPFRGHGACWLRCFLENPGHMEYRLVTTGNRCLRVKRSGYLSAGWHDCPLELEGLSNGLYYVLVEIGGKKEVVRCVILR